MLCMLQGLFVGRIGCSTRLLGAVDVDPLGPALSFDLLWHVEMLGFTFENWDRLRGCYLKGLI